MRSTETTSWRRVRSSASTARCRVPPSASGSPSATTSSGPRTRNSISQRLLSRYSPPRQIFAAKRSQEAVVADKEAEMNVGTRSKALRTLALALAVATIAVPAGVAGLSKGAGGDDGSKKSLVVGNNTLVGISAADRRITSVTAVGQLPEAVAVAGQTIWVHNWDDRTVSAIDARTNRVERTASVPGFSPST